MTKVDFSLMWLGTAPFLVLNTSHIWCFPVVLQGWKRQGVEPWKRGFSPSFPRERLAVILDVHVAWLCLGPCGCCLSRLCAGDAAFQRWVRNMTTSTWSTGQHSDPCPVACGICRIHSSLSVREELLKLLLILPLVSSALSTVSVWCHFITACFFLVSRKTGALAPRSRSWWPVWLVLMSLQSWNLQEPGVKLCSFGFFYYYCLTTSSTNLSQLEAASVIPNLLIFVLQKLKLLRFFFFSVFPHECSSGKSNDIVSEKKALSLP